MVAAAISTIIFMISPWFLLAFVKDLLKPISSIHHSTQLDIDRESNPKCRTTHHSSWLFREICEKAADVCVNNDLEERFEFHPLP